MHIDEACLSSDPGKLTPDKLCTPDMQRQALEGGLRQDAKDVARGTQRQG